MGNKNGIADGIANFGRNRCERFEGGHFSFAFGDEIALVTDKGYFILEANEELWEECKNKVIEAKGNHEEIVAFWKEKHETIPENSWSSDWEKLV